MFLCQTYFEFGTNFIEEFFASTRLDSCQQVSPKMVLKSGMTNFISKSDLVTCVYCKYPQIAKINMYSLVSVLLQKKFNILKEKYVLLFVKIEQKQHRASINQIKFIYSEKATKFCEIFPLLLTVCTVVKSKGKILQNSVAFSEYMNFTLVHYGLYWQESLVPFEKCLNPFLYYSQTVLRIYNFTLNDLLAEQAFCPSSYFSQTCNLQIELVCLDWADKM